MRSSIASSCAKPGPELLERPIWMPHSYQINDSGQPISAKTFRRANFHLPENAFVFCCFNNTYKIEPKMFDLWMRLLKAVPGSVLWLLRSNPQAEENLKREAAARGVAADRLLFDGKLAEGSASGPPDAGRSGAGYLHL